MGNRKLTLSAFLAATSALLLSVTLPSQVGAAPKKAADYVIKNATIHTMDEAKPMAQAVAITGNTITYVGDTAGVAARIGEDTQVIDAEGHLMIPGFNETHLHLLVAAAAVSGVVLAQGDTAEDVARKVAEYAKKHPGSSTIFGTGVRATVLSTGEAHRSILDKVAPDRGVLLLDETFHNAWVNTKALEMAGITKDTADPANGTYVHDAKGELTGVIQGTPAHIPVIVGSKAVTAETIAAAMPEMLKILTSYGFTGLIEMGFPFSTEAGYQSLVDLDNEGKLPVRVSLAYMFNSVELGDKVIATIQDFSKRFKSEHVWLDTMKIIGDGVTENHTAAFLQPYLDVKGSGALTVPTDFLRDKAMRAAKMGFNVTAHTVGDLAYRTLLDVYSEIRAAGYKNVVLSTTHSWWVQPDDVPRWAKNNVIVQTAGIWVFFRPAYVKSLGAERNNTLQFPLRGWEDSGAVLALGSDYPATDGGLQGLNPFNNIYSTLTRKLAPPLIGIVGKKEDPLPPVDQVLTVDEALRAYTANGAKMMGKFDKFGSITVGKKADLTVLSQNLYKIDVDDITKTYVLLTMMDGRITWVEPSILAGPLSHLDVGHDWQE